MNWLRKYLKWVTVIYCLSLTGCTTTGASGDFCDVYRVIDMPSSQAALLDRKYQERILVNERYQFKHCLAE